MDDESTLQELYRLEAERKRRSIPAEVLETAWVAEAQIEAVVDAVLVVLDLDPSAEAHARRAGEWSARIAAALPSGPDPATARRACVLAGAAPERLQRIPELAHLAPHLADYRRFAADPTGPAWRLLPVIVAVAREFDARIVTGERSARSILRSMLAEAAPTNRAIVQALANAIASPRGRTAVA